MNANKHNQIQINSASIVDLRAEFLRRQEEVRLKKNVRNFDDVPKPSTDQFVADSADDRMYDKNVHKISRLPKKLLASANSTLNKKKTKKEYSDSLQDSTNEIDLQLKKEEESAFEKSRIMLEKKTILYEQMASGFVAIDPDNEDLLVDFDKKSKENDCTNSDQQDEDEELIEYEDEFGRTRLVKRKNLPRHHNERDMERKQNKKRSYEPAAEWTLENELLSEDMRTEIERREWEEDAREEIESGNRRKVNIHYENIREGEIRDHGVAFFNFSVDEETRAQQMEMLDNMRKETEDKQSEKQRIKQKRKQMLKDRLAKVAARKGITLVESESSESEPETAPITIEKAKLKPEPKLLKVNKVRDWDVGKEGLFSSVSSSAETTSKSPFYSQEKYLEKRREERMNEFAPPTNYSTYKTRPSSSSSYNSNKRNFRDHETHIPPPPPPPPPTPSLPPESNLPIDMTAFINSKLSQIRKNVSSNQSTRNDE